MFCAFKSLQYEARAHFYCFICSPLLCLSYWDLPKSCTSSANILRHMRCSFSLLRQGPVACSVISTALLSVSQDSYNPCGYNLRVSWIVFLHRSFCIFVPIFFPSFLFYRLDYVLAYLRLLVQEVTSRNIILADYRMPCLLGSVFPEVWYSKDFKGFEARNTLITIYSLVGLNERN